MKKYSVFCCLISAALLGCKTTSQQHPKVVNFPDFSAEAHRGGRGLMPENTIAAMKNAMEIPSITTLEMDTHITKDGKVIVVHDDYMNPNFVLAKGGIEIPKADAKKYVHYQMDYNFIRSFDVGSKKYANFPQQRKLNTYVPLLSELIDSVQNQIRLKNTKQYFYNIETKCDVEGDNVTNPVPEVFVKLLMDVIKKKKITPYVVIQSFDKRTIQLIHQKYPQVRTSFLVENKGTYEEFIADLGYKPFIISPNTKLVDANFVKKAHADGVKVIPWTANTAQEITRLKNLGVDGIISDYPNLL
jgi:glycerophosphoryl diester phosphodiesterase